VRARVRRRRPLWLHRDELYFAVAVVLVLLVATFLAWRRDLLRSSGFALAVVIATALLIPNLVWEAGHSWASVHWFLNPAASATDETRPQFVVNVILLAGVAAPVAVAGVRALIRDRALRPLGWTVVGTVAAYLVLGGKSYYALPVIVFAFAAGAPALDRWITRRPHRLLAFSTGFAAVSILLLPLALPVLPLHTAVSLGVVKARSDYQSEVGWPAYVGLVKRNSADADVIVAQNYGEAGALRVRGHVLHRVSPRRPDLRGERQRRGRRADGALHAPRIAGPRLAGHRRGAGVTVSRGTSGRCRP
jgi:hypothetical protein